MLLRRRLMAEVADRTFLSLGTKYRPQHCLSHYAFRASQAVDGVSEGQILSRHRALAR